MKGGFSTARVLSGAALVVIVVKSCPWFIDTKQTPVKTLALGMVTFFPMVSIGESLFLQRKNHIHVHNFKGIGISIRFLSTCIFIETETLTTVCKNVLCQCTMSVCHPNIRSLLTLMSVGTLLSANAFSCSIVVSYNICK